jgi:RNA polymerase sigma-70 factor, ECF subfamily
VHYGKEKIGLVQNQALPGKRKFPTLLWPVVSMRCRNPIFSPVEMNFIDNDFDDALVIRDIFKGNIDSFEILMNKYQDHVSRIIRNHVPRDYAPEVAHDTFVQAYQSLRGFKGTGPFKHWLAKIAIRCCHDFWRGFYQQQGNRASPLPDDCRNWVEHLVTNQSQEGDAQRIEARDLLQWALGQLSAADRMVLTLTHLNGYSVAEAAELLDWSVIRVKVQSHRARKKLRRILADTLPQGLS